MRHEYKCVKNTEYNSDTTYCTIRLQRVIIYLNIKKITWHSIFVVTKNIVRCFSWSTEVYSLEVHLSSIKHLILSWHNISRSTLVQVMAWCRQAPSHYLIQYWIITNNTLRKTSPIISSSNTFVSNQSIFLTHNLKMTGTFPSDQWINENWPVFVCHEQSTWHATLAQCLARELICWASIQIDLANAGEVLPR